ncbi:hypothetical protein C3495_06405 [Clostridiaceae bacterium 14S0207]|nr:hypothetical protein C3495_06405 [Clostridiaceae bacterium 14S0207]
MKDNKYLTLIESSILNYSEECKRKFIQQLLKNNIATRNKNDINKIYIKGVPSVDEKIKLCFSKNQEVVRVFEMFEFMKGYKYSFLNKIQNGNNINLTDINLYASDIKNLEINKIGIEKPIFYETEEILLIKFHKMINVIDMEDGMKSDIRYPLLVVIHKKLNLLEFRFDKLTHKKSDDFYEITMGPIISFLMSKLKVEFVTYELGKKMTSLVENNKSDIKEEICSIGYSDDKGIVMKYGKSSTMPFLGELEDLIKNKSNIFDKNKDTQNCRDILEEFIFERKELSSKHFRELTWLNPPYSEDSKDKKKKFMKTKVIFNYKGRNKDLLVYYYSNNNDMERMNYVIKYIDKIK